MTFHCPFREGVSGAEHVREHFEVVASMLGARSLAVEAMVCDAEPELLAFAAFPVIQRKKIWSTDPLEQLESKRRTDVIGGSQPGRAASRAVDEFVRYL